MNSDACARCGRTSARSAVWPDGRICNRCYIAAKRTHGTCAHCGHTGVLPGRSEDGNLCRTCSGIRLNVDCVRCGAEEELYSAGRCWRCTLADIVDEVLAGPDGHMHPQLLPLADAIKTMKRANSGITWIRQPHVDHFLRTLAANPAAITHQGLDQLPRSRTREYVRELLIEHEVLPTRNRYLAEFGDWAAAKKETLSDPAHQGILEQFLRWHQSRRLQSVDTTARAIAYGKFLDAKQTTTVAVLFLNSLTDRGTSLHETRQADLDLFIAAGPQTHRRAETFLRWAIKHRHCPPLEITQRERASQDAFGHTRRINGLRRILTDTTIGLGHRAAAGLVLLYGQPITTIIALRLDQIQSAPSGELQLRIKDQWMPVPPPFDQLLRDWIQDRANLQTAAHRDSPWLFPGYTPGKHVHANHLSGTLRDLDIPPRDARTATWRDLVRNGPPSVLAELLGIHPNTAEQHKQLAAADYARYTSLRTSTPTANAADP